MASMKQGIARTNELINFLVGIRDDMVVLERLEPLIVDDDRLAFLTDCQQRLVKVRGFLTPVDIRTLTRTPVDERPVTDPT